MTRYIDLDSPCIDPGFGYENKDGYVRIWDKPKPSGGSLVMRHRWFWELGSGPIPDGYEIDHLCKNRRCCNVRHLECITGSEHAVKSNKERYLEDYVGFKNLYHSCFEDEVFSRKDWAGMMQKSVATINNWVRRYRQEEIH